MAAPLVVLDTEVVVSGLIGKEVASSYQILSAVETGDVRLALSDVGLRELHRATSYPEVEDKISSPARTLRVGMSLGLMGNLFHPPRLEWSSILDRDDWWMLDLAYEAGADFIVTRNERHLGPARDYGFEVITPPQLLDQLRT